MKRLNPTSSEFGDHPEVHAGLWTQARLAVLIRKLVPSSS